MISDRKEMRQEYGFRRPTFHNVLGLETLSLLALRAHEDTTCIGITLILAPKSSCVSRMSFPPYVYIEALNNVLF